MFILTLCLSKILFNISLPNIRICFHKQTNEMHVFSMYLPKTFFVHSTCFERLFLSSSAVHMLLYQQLCTYHVNVSICSAERLETLAWYVQSCWYSNLRTADDERNSLSKHVECTKNVLDKYILKKCLLLVAYGIECDARSVQCQIWIYLIVEGFRMKFRKDSCKNSLYYLFLSFITQTILRGSSLLLLLLVLLRNSLFTW